MAALHPDSTCGHCGQPAAAHRWLAYDRTATVDCSGEA
jgi:hypothetical protein